MAARRIVLRLAAFFAAFAAALSLVAFFTPAPPRVLRGSRAAPPAISCYPAAQFVLSDNLDADVELISLDRENARSYARLRLRLVGGSAAPERLWARTYFFNPSDPSGRVRAGEAVELVRPFAEGRSVPVTISAPCSWCADADAPAGNYFARVEFHADCDDWERCASASFPRVAPGPGPLFDIRTAVPVAVHVEGMPRR